MTPTVLKRLFPLIAVILFFAPFLPAYAAPVPAPLFYLPLDSDIQDASGNGVSVSATGATVVADDVKGGALNFSTTTQSLTVSQSLPGSYTKSVWLYLDTLATSGYGFNIITNESGSFFWISNQQYNAGPPATWTLRGGHFGAANATAVWDAAPFPLKTWVHVAMTYDTTINQYALYKNGVLISTSTASNDPSASTNFTIGNFAGTNGWVGKMSDVAVWDSVLDTSQITALYGGDVGLGTPIDPDGAGTTTVLPIPRLYMPFSTSTTADISGNSYTITSSGGSIVSDPERGSVLRQTANTNKVSTDAPLPTSFTKAAWVNLSTTTTSGYGFNILSNENSSFLWVTNISSAWRLAAGHFGSGGPYYVQDSGFTKDVWTHIALTYSAPTKTYCLYKNTILVQCTNASDAVPASQTTTVGNFSDINGWIGRLSNVGMWNGVLSLDQIKATYSGLTGLENTTISDAPRNLRATSTTSTVNLAWDRPLSAGGTVITNYIIEYKKIGDISWSTYSTPVSTSTTRSITGLEVGEKYYFRVYAVNAQGTSVASNIISQIVAPKYFYIISTGQSLSTGSGSSPALSTTQPYNNLMFSPGVEGTTTPLIALKESGTGENGNIETPSSGIANGLYGAGETGGPIIVGLHGHNGTTYSGLKKGTSYYNRGITQLTNAYNYIDSISGVLVPSAITVVHGENDYFAGNSAEYASYLEEWRSDYEADAEGITGESLTLPLFTNQMNTALTGELAVAQLEASRDNPATIFLIGPKYQYTYANDHLHLTNTDSRYMGEMFAKVMSKVIFKNETWKPLSPTTVVRDGNIVTINYHIPYGQLAIDTSNVAERTNYGFEFAQTDGNSVSISNVELTQSNTAVKITLSDVPTGTDQRIRYAWSCPGGYSGYPSCGGAQDATRVGGNIRDTDTTISSSSDSSGLPLYDWSVTFDEPITLAPEDTENNTPVSVAPTYGFSSGYVGSVSSSQHTQNPATSTVWNIVPIDLNSQLRFTKSLRYGQRNSDIKILQKILNANGFTVAKTGPGSNGNETDYFGPATKAAVIRLQLQYGIIRSSKEAVAGLVGPLTRGVLNRMLGK